MYSAGPSPPCTLLLSFAFLKFQGEEEEKRGWGHWAPVVTVGAMSWQRKCRGRQGQDPVLLISSQALTYNLRHKGRLLNGSTSLFYFKNNLLLIMHAFSCVPLQATAS